MNSWVGSREKWGRHLSKDTGSAGYAESKRLTPPR